MAPSLILVRHAAPKIDERVSSTLWRLSEEGCAAAVALSEQLAELRPQALVSSSEPKARETAYILAQRLDLTVTADDGFIEHQRPGLVFTQREQFEQSIGKVFERPSERLFGGESANEACQRFDEALARHTERPLVVVTHGTVLTLFVSRRTALDAMTLWSSLNLPEALILDEKMQLTARLRV